MTYFFQNFHQLYFQHFQKWTFSSYGPKEIFSKISKIEILNLKNFRNFYEILVIFEGQKSRGSGDRKKLKFFVSLVSDLLYPTQLYGPLHFFGVFSTKKRVYLKIRENIENIFLHLFTISIFWLHEILVKKNEKPTK